MRAGFFQGNLPFFKGNTALLERIRREIVSDFPADAALTPRKKRGFSVCSVAGRRSRDYRSNPHFQCGIALGSGLIIGQYILTGIIL